MVENYLRQVRLMRTRRDFLKVASAPLGATLLAACGGGGGGSAAVNTGESATIATSSPPPSPAPSTSPSPSPTPPSPTPPSPPPPPPPAPPAPPPYTGPIPAWVSALPVGAWKEIENTALSAVAPTPTPLGNSGPRAKIKTWNGACLKRAGSVFMLGAAGGHNDYGGNEVNALNLNSETPRWSQLCAPSANSQIVNGSGDGDGTPTQLNLDGRPSSTHTYHSTQFIDSLNLMVVFSSPGYSGPAGASTPAGWGHKSDAINHAFSVAAGDWQIPSSLPNFPGTGDFTSALCVRHPWTDDVWYSKNYGDGIYKWTASTNKWAKLPDTYSRNPWYCGAAIDPKRSRMLIVGGYSAPAEVRGLDGLTSTGIKFGGLGASELQKAEQYSAVCYDEANDCYWVLYVVKDASGNAASTRLLKVTAEDFVVSEPTTNTSSLPLRENGIHNSVQYVPELKGLVYAPTYEGNVYFIRTA